MGERVRCGSSTPGARRDSNPCYSLERAVLTPGGGPSTLLLSATIEIGVPFHQSERRRRVGSLELFRAESMERGVRSASTPSACRRGREPPLRRRAAYLPLQGDSRWCVVDREN